jgi:dTDP-4-amino-4,6-dideoxygalactose transaminase
MKAMCGDIKVPIQPYPKMIQTQMQIPFVDLYAQYQTIKAEIDQAIEKVITQTAFIRGPFVNRFNEEFAEAYGVKHCIGVANGTDAIYIVLKMLGIGPGDEVITVANSWISSSETIGQTGATPVFADTEENYFTIDPAQIEARITERTKAVIPVHLTGQVCQMDQIVEICQRHGLYLIEDCAQSHFTQFKGQNAGTFGDAATFSFYPGKNLGAYGDAGAILTNDDELARKIRMYANHGARVKHDHLMEGINSRLDGIQAAILSVKLPYIHRWTEARIAIAQQYDALLADIPQVICPSVRPESRHSYHLYVIRTERREELQNWLKERGVATAIHYPVPLPLMPAYQHLGYNAEEFPVVSAYQHQILSLPMYPEMKEEAVRYVAQCVREFFEQNS